MNRGGLAYHKVTTLVKQHQIACENHEKDISKSFSLGKERYAAPGVDVDHALKTLSTIPISLHCWQGDDVAALNIFGGALGGGLAVTNYPGKARPPNSMSTSTRR